MKEETLKKLKELAQSQKISFGTVPEGLSVEYNLTDEELRELVELEYGQTSQSLESLFTTLCKKFVNSVVKNGTEV